MKWGHLNSLLTGSMWRLIQSGRWDTEAELECLLDGGPCQAACAKVFLEGLRQLVLPVQTVMVRKEQVRTYIANPPRLRYCESSSFSGIMGGPSLGPKTQRDVDITPTVHSHAWLLGAVYEIILTLCQLSLLWSSQYFPNIRRYHVTTPNLSNFSSWVV